MLHMTFSFVAITQPEVNIYIKNDTGKESAEI